MSKEHEGFEVGENLFYKEGEVLLEVEVLVVEPIGLVTRYRLRVMSVISREFGRLSGHEFHSYQVKGRGLEGSGQLTRESPEDWDIGMAA